MSTVAHLRLCLTAALAVALPLAAQHTAPPVAVPQIDRQADQPTPPASHTLHLDVSVEAKAGQNVTGLQPQEFTLFDNKTPSPITSFKVLTPTQEPVEVILVIDAVNARFGTVAIVRDQVGRFLRADEGRLAYPTTLAVLEDKGLQSIPGFSSDGNLLDDSLKKLSIGLREITRSSGIYGADDRVQISLNAVHQLSRYAATLPGRKIILWISPGWPLLSGPGINLDSKQHEAIFRDVVGFSNELRQSNVTVYGINPIGPAENFLRANYYQAFEKGVGKPNDTDLADLSLQVLALQSGGLALEGSSDVAGLLKRCLADSASWYQLTVEPRPAEHPNEYHHLEVKLDKPGYKIRTRDGYYAQP